MKPTFLHLFTPSASLRALRRLSVLALLPGIAALAPAALAQAPAPSGPVLLTIKAGEAAAKVSPVFYGLMTEEINYAYDGGLYAELINNRTFKDRQNPLHYWNYWRLGEGAGEGNSISVVTDQPLNEVLTNSLKL